MTSFRDRRVATHAHNYKLPDERREADSVVPVTVAVADRADGRPMLEHRKAARRRCDSALFAAPSKNTVAPLVRPDLGFDRSAIMSLAHLEYGDAAGAKSWSECLGQAWDLAKTLRARRAAGDASELLGKLAHRAASLRRRADRPKLHSGAIAFARARASRIEARHG